MTVFILTVRDDCPHESCVDKTILNGTKYSWTLFTDFMNEHCNVYVYVAIMMRVFNCGKYTDFISHRPHDVILYIFK